MCLLAWGKRIHEKNQKSKILRHCPFWFRKKCNPSWFTDLMMKNKVAVLNQGKKVNFAHCYFFKAGVWCSSVVKARLLSAREVLGSFPG
jgi:hypothetical protein